MTLTQVLLGEADVTYAVTERLFRRVRDDELAWAPPLGENWMSVGQLLMHCACFGCGKAVRGFVTGDWGAGDDEATAQEHIPPAGRLPCVKTVAEALDLLAEDRQLAVASIRAAGEDDLLKRAMVAPWGGPEMPLVQHLLRMIAHLAQHKGQLFYYLKMMGGDVNTEDPWGPPSRQETPLSGGGARREQ